MGTGLHAEKRSLSSWGEENDRTRRRPIFCGVCGSEITGRSIEWNKKGRSWTSYFSAIAGMSTGRKTN